MATTMSNDEILDAIGHKTVLELADLIEAFKTKFNVTVVAVAAPAGGAGGAAAAVEEQTEFTVILKATGDKKINVIKVVREITSLGSEGSQGPGRRRAEHDEGRRVQGRGRGNEEATRGPGRDRRAEVSRRLIPSGVAARDLPESDLISARRQLTSN